MSEIGDLLKIAGAIDTFVGRTAPGDDRRRQLANLVPAYRVGARFGWYERLRIRLERQVEERNVEGLPNLDEQEDEQLGGFVGEILERGLAESTPYASMLPRRLLVITVASRVFPDQVVPTEGDSPALEALSVPGILAGSPQLQTPAEGPPDRIELDEAEVRYRAEQLLAALADPAQLESIEGWNEFLRSHLDLVSSQLANLPPPCATRVVEQSADRGTVVLLQTEHCIKGVDLQTLAIKFLEPSDWKQCGGWWCDMQRTPGAGAPLERYFEFVADACPQETPLFLNVKVFLDFAKPIDDSDRKVVTYKQVDDRNFFVNGLRANNMVDVDRGVIEVRKEPGHVHVSTSKRISFTAPINLGELLEELAMFACYLGYGDTATDMICNCSGGQPEAVGCDVAPFTSPVHRFVQLAYQCVEEAGVEARRVADHIGSSASSPETVARDCSRMVALAVRGWGKLATTYFEAVGEFLKPLARSSLRVPPREVGPFRLASPLTAECALSLVGPLASPYGETIDVGRVAIHPHELGPGGQEFALTVDVSEAQGTVYLGWVVAKDKATGAMTPPVRVDVIVP
jgi:hypothetical protein